MHWMYFHRMLLYIIRSDSCWMYFSLEESFLKLTNLFLNYSMTIGASLKLTVILYLMMLSFFTLSVRGNLWILFSFPLIVKEMSVLKARINEISWKIGTLEKAWISILSSPSLKKNWRPRSFRKLLLKLTNLVSFSEL